MQRVENLPHRAHVADETAFGKLELQMSGWRVRILQDTRNVVAQPWIAQYRRGKIDADVEVRALRQAPAPLPRESADSLNDPTCHRNDDSGLLRDGKELL